MSFYKLNSRVKKWFTIIISKVKNLHFSRLARKSRHFVWFLVLKTTKSRKKPKSTGIQNTFGPNNQTDWSLEKSTFETFLKCDYFLRRKARRRWRPKQTSRRASEASRNVSTSECYSGSAGLHSGCCDVARGAQRGLIQFRILFEIIITICSFFFGGPHGPR